MTILTQLVRFWEKMQERPSTVSKHVLPIRVGHSILRLGEAFFGPAEALIGATQPSVQRAVASPHSAESR